MTARCVRFSSGSCSTLSFSSGRFSGPRRVSRPLFFLLPCWLFCLLSLGSPGGRNSNFNRQRPIWLWGVILRPADSAFLALSCIIGWREPLLQPFRRCASLLSRAELLVSAKWGRPKFCGRRFSLKLHLNYVRMKNPSLQPAPCVLWCLLLITALGPGMVEAFAQSPRAAATIGPIQLSAQPEIDAGFRLLYELNFAEARATFAGWGSRHPGEALGPAVEAASYLFQEFDRQNALSSEFFLDDDRLLGGVKGTPDPKVRDAF